MRFIIFENVYIYIYTIPLYLVCYLEWSLHPNSNNDSQTRRIHFPRQRGTDKIKTEKENSIGGPNVAGNIPFMTLPIFCPDLTIKKKKNTQVKKEKGK